MSIFPKLKRVLYGAAMLHDMACHPIQNSLMFWKILKPLNYSYFVKIMTGKPKIGNLTNMTELDPFRKS